MPNHQAFDNRPALKLDMERDDGQAAKYYLIVKFTSMLSIQISFSSCTSLFPDEFP
jgi:hypothetical protein